MAFLGSFIHSNCVEVTGTSLVRQRLEINREKSYHVTVPFSCPFLDVFVVMRLGRHSGFEFSLPGLAVTAPLPIEQATPVYINFISGLSRYLKNKTMGIPFWDWTEEETDMPYLLRDPEIYDPILKRFIKNPFYRTFIRTKDGSRK